MPERAWLDQTALQFSALCSLFQLSRMLLRLRGDRTGDEQPYWLKTTDPVALYVTLCYGLYQGGVDSGWKLTLKVFRPGQQLQQLAVDSHYTSGISIAGKLCGRLQIVHESG